MAARFEKAFAPGAVPDGFDEKGPFQMVPVGGTREMSAVTEAESCVLRTAQPNVARLKNLRTSIGTPLAGDVPAAGLTLQPNSRVSFTISGQSVGHTEALLIGPDGRSRNFMSISVKAQIIHTVSIVLLADRVRGTSRQPDDVLQILSRVDGIFRPQANIGFRPLAAPLYLFLEEKLGSPIMLAGADDKTQVILEGLLAKRPDFFSARIVLFCSTDVEDNRGDLGGATFPVPRFKTAFCFVEDDGMPAGNPTTVRIFAHEFGHALGLEHTVKPGHLMVETASLIRSKLDQFEINGINPTGL